MILVVVLNTSSESSVSYRGIDLKSSVPLSMIKDVDVRTGLNRDLDYILNAFPELPKTPEFRRDVGIMAAASPRMFGKSPAELQEPDVDTTINNVLKANSDYLTKYGDRGDMTRMNAIIDWTTKLKIEPVCTTPAPKTCVYGSTVDNTFTNLAVTLLDMHGLEWKNTYGFAVAWVLLRGSFWPEIYKTDYSKLPIETVLKQ